MQSMRRSKLNMHGLRKKSSLRVGILMFRHMVVGIGQPVSHGHFLDLGEDGLELFVREQILRKDFPNVRS